MGGWLGGPEQGRRRELAGDGVQSQWVANEDGERSVDGGFNEDGRENNSFSHEQKGGSGGRSGSKANG